MNRQRCGQEKREQQGKIIAASDAVETMAYLLIIGEKAPRKMLSRGRCSLFFKGKAVAGEIQFVAHGDHLFL